MAEISFRKQKALEIILLSGTTLESLEKERAAGRLQKSTRLSEIQDLLTSALKFGQTLLETDDEPLTEGERQVLLFSLKVAGAVPAE
jgi:hypothetical protein